MVLADTTESQLVDTEHVYSLKLDASWLCLTNNRINKIHFSLPMTVDWCEDLFLYTELWCNNYVTCIMYASTFCTTTSVTTTDFQVNCLEREPLYPASSVEPLKATRCTDLNCGKSPVGFILSSSTAGLLREEALCSIIFILLLAHQSLIDWLS